MNAKCEQGVMGTKRRERLGESSSGGGEGGGVLRTPLCKP